MSKLLFIGAHYDDIELSGGGTIVKMLEQGHDVMYVGLSTCRNRLLEQECMASLKELGVTKVMIQDFPYRTFDQMRQDILDLLINIRNQYQPDIIFTHSTNDRHIDHSVVGAESLRAFRNETVITYTAPWNRTSEAKQDNYYVQLTEDQLNHKGMALQCYKSQSHREYMSQSELTANFTGSIIRVNYAESFYIERMIV